MAKNIVVFSDGTGQDGGVRPEQRVSNVYKIYRACRNGAENSIDPQEQVSFYDPGLGTDIGSTALTAPVRFVQKLLGSVTGRGITKNVADCYEFIINHWQPGDRIFLIGFSRGAYTVRCIANLLMLCGVPTRAPTGPLQRYRKSVRDIAGEAVDTVLEHGAGHPRSDFEDERQELARRFRAKYGSNHETATPGRSNAAPHFIGVFDTVAALGATGLRRFLIRAGLTLGAIVLIASLAFIPAVFVWIPLYFFGASFWTTIFTVLGLSVVGVGGVLWYKQWKSYRKTIRDFPNPGDVHTHVAEWKGENFDRLLSQFVHYARSANAIDETRKDFARVAWGGVVEGAPAQVEGHDRLIQLWFAGNHSDVGGSYVETESRLSDIALKWMVEQATKVPNGLHVAGLKAPGDATDNPNLRVFPSCDGVQHCEVVGMQDTIESMVPAFLMRFSGSLKWPVKIRDIRPDAPVHHTVVERFKMETVTQADGIGPYRPLALANHSQFKDYYKPVMDGAPKA